ncbi:hypothetical protein SO694_000761101 [Aureococcus anophagefferens]|uniref:Uncharacterized protein n=1 Tax=Aureococcus anophagefferens TaxID=44056 RepID=A0ABR1FHY6_AURAN
MAKHPALMKRKAPDANNTQPSTAPSPQQQRAAILASPTKASPTAKRSWSQPLGPLSKKRPPPQPLADSNTLKRPRPASPSSSSASSLEGDAVAAARARRRRASGPGPRGPAAAARGEDRRDGGPRLRGRLLQREARHARAANFKKSLRDIIKNTDPKVLMLDYFWLQPGYYEERYGMNWLQSKIRELFVSYGARCSSCPSTARAVRRMHDASFDDRPAGIEIEFVSEADGLKHHPLVARRHIDADLRALSGAGVDWRAYLDGLCARSRRARALAPRAPAPRAAAEAPVAAPPGKSPAPPAAPAAAPPAPPPLFDEDSDDEDTPLSVLLARAGP